ncbi:protein of unknown function [Vibrio tapetis subsp. tapetis]|uniref:Uncharacterized protein n=1 Tax=Vibrio tapetis subsp. tapetis TaxID=1671868 RepID=A0A2N8ZM54_9VIBR|nr:protein of unknown function [Vibrio tapetis subsp. tapetis]
MPILTLLSVYFQVECQQTLLTTSTLKRLSKRMKNEFKTAT